MRARLTLILLPTVVTCVLLFTPAAVARAGTATSTPAGGWLSRSTAGLHQPAQLVERMRDSERQRVLAVVRS
jgi:hypothetical protein